MTESENSTTHNAFMAGSAAAAAGSAGAIAAYNGHLPEGAEYVSQAKDLVEPVFYDPELTKSGASSLKDYAVGNVDTAMHFMSGAGLSGMANKVLEPENRTKALAAGLGAGTLGYAMLKEGMYEGALDAFDVSYESLKAASSPLEHVAEEANDIDLNADQERDIKADTGGVMTERSLSSTPSANVEDEKTSEVNQQEPGADSLLDSYKGTWTPKVLDESGGAGQPTAT